MLPIALSLVIESLWLILSPFNLQSTLIVSGLCLLSFLLLGSILFYQRRFYRFSICLFSILGISLSLFLYIPQLHHYQLIQQSYPLSFSATFEIDRNQYASSTTIKLLKIHTIDAPDDTQQESLKNALKQSSIRVYNIDPEIKKTLQEGEQYQASIQVRPRTYRNIPGDSQRILQALARKEIGYGRFNDTPLKIKEISAIDSQRNFIESHLITHYPQGHYLSALSVGKTQHLQQKDWNILRQTGTIHLVSISGLHLSLTAFYAFIFFRVLFGLLAFKYVTPFKAAAGLSIIVAWYYALFAGMSLPTLRAAIMFSIAMLSLLISRPIFSLQGVSIALMIILSIMPLSLLMPGFWLSFVAVIILILAAKVFSTPLKAIVLTQIVISLLLIPLTASFFGEVSLVSPFINFFAIPWTSTMIMPALLIGTLLLLIHPMLATPFLSLADQGVFVLIKAIDGSAKVPYASILTAKMSLSLAVIITFTTLSLLYAYPILKRGRGLSILHRLRKILLKYPKAYFSRINTANKKGFRRSMLLIMLVLMLFVSKLILSQKVEKTASSSPINIYLLPVGEGLSLLFHSKELTFLYDTGNSFGQFDAGRDVIIPTLRNLDIKHLDALFLSLRNQQHIGGTRSVRDHFKESSIVAHKDLVWLVETATDCDNYYYQSEMITIVPLPQIESSCAFKVTMQNQVELYLISDITPEEALHLEKILHDDPSLQSPSTLLLYPQQGRRFYNLLGEWDKISDKTASSSISPPHPIIALLSTKNSHEKIKQKEGFDIYNAYYGTIHIQIPRYQDMLIKPIIYHYRDSQCYWWLSPKHIQ